jgi:hypothetical protein
LEASNSLNYFMPLCLKDDPKGKLFRMIWRGARSLAGMTA